jgi:nucleotide-binding universal stress UspA family protein
MAHNQAIALNKNILIAVDDSENSRRAVHYVGFLLGRAADVHATLLHVIPEPEEDYFPEAAQKERWIDNYRRRMTKVLADYRQMLVEAGFPESAVEQQLPLRFCPSMAECILSERKQRRYGTVVVGRQGLSRKEEFLFGSISSKIVNHARHCAVWVVE